MPDPGPSTGVSVLIVSWNSLNLIKACLESIEQQTVARAQVVVVDNASTDGSLEWLRAQPGLELVESKSNLGFAAANNLGLRSCRGAAVLCLNPDVELAPRYIELCLGHLDNPRIASVTGKLLRAVPEATIDSTGHAVFDVGWAENRGEDQPDRGFDSAGEVFGVCAAAALYRVAALRSAEVEGEVFDASYFAYIEDVDLDWRLRWLGWQAWYEPGAVATHHRSAGGGPASARIMRHILANRILTVVKNYDRRALARNLPGFAAFTVVKTFDFGRRHPSAMLGLVDAARLLPAAIRKRRWLKARRQASPAEVSGWLKPFPWWAKVTQRARRPVTTAPAAVSGPVTPAPTGASRARWGWLRHPLVWLALMVSIFFYKELVLGLTFSPADLLFVVNPWHAVSPPGFTAPINDLRSDEVVIAFPHRVDIISDIKRFGLPLWQEHTLAGSANTFSLHSLGAFAYPPFLAYLVLPPKVADTVLHLSIPPLGGLAMYLLLGRLIKRRSGRLFGAVAFAFNGYSIVWLSAFPLPAIVASLPLAVYLAWRFLEDRSWVCGALFAAVVAAVLGFSYPPGSLILVTLVAIFVLCWWAQNLRRVPAVLLLAGLGIIAIGLSAVAVVPTINELAGYATRGYRGPITVGIPLRFLATFVFPNVAGNPIAHDWSAIGNYCEFVAYDGALPLMLALGGGATLFFRRLRGSPLVVAAVAIGLLSFALAYVNPVIRVVDARPPFNNLNPARWNMGVEFAIAVLAAYALEQLLDSRRARHVVVAVAAGAIAVVAAAAAILFIKRHQFLAVDDFVTRDYRLRLVLLAADIVVLAWLAWGSRRALVGAAAVGVLFADLFSFGVDFNPALPSDQVYPSTSAISYLASHSSGYRVLPVNGIYGVDEYNAYGIDVMTGYDHFRDDGYVAFLGSNIAPGEREVWRSFGYLTVGSSLNLDDPVFNELSVKFAYFPSAAVAASRSGSWKPVYAGDDGAIFENPNVLPRQFMVTDGQPVAVDHQELRPDQDHFRVNGGGLLVWSKPYSPYWHVSLNGREVATGSYQGYLLATEVPSPGATVDIAYRPTDYYQGAAISGFSLLLLVALVGWRSWTNRRRMTRGA